MVVLCQYTQNHWGVYFKWIHCMAYELCLNKAVKNKEQSLYYCDVVLSTSCCILWMPAFWCREHFSQRSGVGTLFACVAILWAGRACDLHSQSASRGRASFTEHANLPPFQQFLRNLTWEMIFPGLTKCTWNRVASCLWDQKLDVLTNLDHF